jgi:hypothetical protein
MAPWLAIRVVCHPPNTVPPLNWLGVTVRESIVIEGGGGGQAVLGCWLNTLRTSFSTEGGVCAMAALPSQASSRPARTGNRKEFFRPQREHQPLAPGPQSLMM